MWRRWERLALVIPVALSLTSLRWGFNPNSGQSSSRCVEELVEELVEDRIAAAVTVGVEVSAGALLPQAASSRQASDARPRRSWEARMREF